MTPTAPPSNRLAEKTPIIELTTEEFISWMSPSDDTRLIEFFASWCIYHMLSRRKLEQLHAAFGGSVRAGSMDCVGNEEVFHSFGINHIPAIGYFAGPVRLFWTGDTDIELILEDIQRAHHKKEQS